MQHSGQTSNFALTRATLQKHTAASAMPVWKAVLSLREKAVVSNITGHSFRLLLHFVVQTGQLC